MICGLVRVAAMMSLKVGSEFGAQAWVEGSVNIDD
jgi:hypothetical protein